ncbi:MAG: hypothetical protein M3536_00955 [Actinomycetota bacterium]|nr:hypothetical protein [Actinomycetota bacterium]
MTKLAELDPDAFYRPEFMAPIMGLYNTELRRYCKESGLYTKLSNRRIMLNVDDAKAISQWIRDRKTAAEDWAAESEAEHDPFK